MLRIGGDRQHGLGRDLEQEIVDDGLVLVGDGRGQREHDVILWHRQQVGLAISKPLLGSGGLALRTVPVAAGVVGDGGIGAVLAAHAWPPRAAVRQRSIADMTFSWSRLTWRAWA
jgi:hypothetical protein